MTKPKRNKVNTLLGPTAERWYQDNFSTLGAGTTYALESFYHVCRNGLAEVKRAQFTAGELGLIIDIVNSMLFMPQLAGQHLMASVEASIDLDDADVKWNVDKAEILGEMNLLSLGGQLALEIWAKGFWEGKRKGQDRTDLEEYVKQLAE